MTASLVVTKRSARVVFPSTRVVLLAGVSVKEESNNTQINTYPQYIKDNADE
jgi:hypothetical protein